MAQKTKKTPAAPKPSVKDALDLIQKLKKSGYSPVSILQDDLLTGNVTTFSTKDFKAVVGNGALPTGPFAKSVMDDFFSPVNNTINSVPDNIGTKGKKPIKWGVGNNYPSEVYKAFKSLPYTAAGQEYQANAVVGLGIDFRYKTLEVSLNGKITEIDIPYKYAGAYLKHKIQLLKAAEADTQEGTQGGETNIPVLSGSPVESNTPSLMPGSPATESKTPLQQAEDDLKTWESVNKELQEFISNNNLNKIDNDLAQDDLALDLYFRSIGIETPTEKDTEKSDYHPKIVSVGNYPCVISRLEELNDDGLSAYTYICEKWRSQKRMDNNPMKTGECIALPNIDVLHPIRSFSEVIKNNKKATWFVLPYKHLSTEQKYYPIPASHSIFPSLTFMYASTLMYDKAAARHNSTMWGKIIYIQDDYLEKLYAASEEGNTPEGQKLIRDALVEKINHFLKFREHNGSTVALESFIGPDGKTPQDSIRIVDVPAPTKSTTEAEIEAMSSCINAGFSLDSRLVGSVPGAQKSSSGTQARELELLETKKLSTRKQQYKHFYRFIIDWNKWDPDHMDPVVREMTLTTLDASKEGLQERSE